MNNRLGVLPPLPWLYLLSALTSLFLSFWINSHEAVINPDAICYLLSAQAIGESGIGDAMHLCGQAQWPFYSALIYGLVQLSQLSYTTVAYLLDGVFSVISVLTFILIVKAMGGSRRVLWLAAAVILLAHEFNNVREYIIRDHGFWAFYLISLLCLLHYFSKPKLVTAFAFSGSLLLATLFRIEGAIFLLVLPWLAWCHFSLPLRQRLRHFVLLSLPLIVAGVAILVWLAFHPQQTLAHLGRVQELLTQFQNGISLMGERFQASKNGLATAVLPLDSIHQAGLVLIIMLIVWYVIMVMGNVSWIYAGLVLYAWRQHCAKLSPSTKKVLLAYLAINILVTFGFFLEHLFLSKRYLIALSLIVMLWVPFALDELCQRWTHWRQRMVLTGVMLWIGLSALGGIVDFGYSKAYIHTAGDWLAAHVPAKATLYANDYQLMYYSQHFGKRIFESLPEALAQETLAQGKWKQYDYLALRFDKKQAVKMAAVLQNIPLVPVRIFSNQRGDQVLIYNVSEQEKKR